MSPSDPLRPAAGRAAVTPLLILAGLGVVLALYAMHVLVGLGGHATDSLFSEWVFDGLLLAAGALILARAWRGERRERAAWAWMGGAMVAYGLGEVYWSLFLASAPNTPSPTPTDAFELSFYPACWISLCLLARSRFPGMRLNVGLDGLIAGAAAAAITSAVLLGPVLSSTGGSVANVATNLAYPVGDMVLLALAVGALALAGRAPGWVLGPIAASFVVHAVADSLYLQQAAMGTYVEGTWLDLLWPVSALLLAYPACVAAPVGARAPSARPAVRVNTWLPTAALLCVLGLLLYGLVRPLNEAAVVFASVGLVAAILRLVLTERENTRLLDAARHEAVTDGLTGLGNRRALVRDLDRRLAEGTPFVLALFDLNGFKRYNDTFGHPAGDALLARLGAQLRNALGAGDRAYRMGGDEFCTLLAADSENAAPASVARAREALSDRGGGFHVSASCGEVLVPTEASTADEALRTADARLYLQKNERLGSARQQLRDVLLAAFAQREPELGAHLRDVGVLAGEVGRRLGLAGSDLEVVVRAAELHDVGKIAVPDSILSKTGPLDAEEWRFMRRHTILGERILSAAPALRPVAVLVRSSHERWDGAGYPDGLAGTQIPLGARIIAACDAWDAMRTDRSYRKALSVEEAIAELDAGAGSQFDPVVAEVLSTVAREAPAGVRARLGV
jgi:two-component system, cell cycle response regulator